MTTKNELDDLQKQLSMTLGQVRSEYMLDSEVFSMFSRPTYWSKIIGPRPCLLVGGRGTGKTTALKGLSYKGQLTLNGPDIESWAAIASYWRIESNVVSAFKGRKLDNDNWINIFSHYVNLRLTQGILEFAIWKFQLDIDKQKPVTIDLKLVCASLNIDDVTDLTALKDLLALEIAKLEARLNGNTRTLLQMSLSALGKPIEYLLIALQADTDLNDKVFAFCLDEYENLEPYQQTVINTLLKHSGDSPYTFKIGMRDSTNRERSTLAAGQPLNDPADYSTVNIVEDLKGRGFAEFAREVCNKRLKSVSGLHNDIIDVLDLLPALSEESEALLLGAEQVRAKLRTRLTEERITQIEMDAFDRLPILEACLVSYWSETKQNAPIEVLRQAIREPKTWRTRTGNYSYSLLFTLRGSVRGPRKYYCGWQTYAQIADGNIRYVLRLLYEALLKHTDDGNTLHAPISAKHQTAAAEQIGENSLRELQGASLIGGQITRLTLGLGRIYGVMAAQPYGHTPEVNQFKVDTIPGGDSTAAAELLNEATSHGSLVAFASDKHAGGSGQTKEYDYQLHPIFSAYFAYSHRRKRRMILREDDIVGLASADSRRSIERILKRSNRTPAATELPEQLSIYSEFFNNDK